MKKVTYDPLLQAVEQEEYTDPESWLFNPVTFLQFITNNAWPTAPWMLSWNDAYRGLEVAMWWWNVKLAIGQEQLKLVVNKTWGVLTEAWYAAVFLEWTQWQRMAVNLAQANWEHTSMSTLWIVTETILQNQEWFITTSWEVNKINTTWSLQWEVWNDWDPLFLSPNVPGWITNVKPQAPNHLVVIWYVQYAHQVNGKIFVKVTNGYELDELHNVLITDPQPGQYLKFDWIVWRNSF